MLRALTRVLMRELARLIDDGVGSMPSLSGGSLLFGDVRPLGTAAAAAAATPAPPSRALSLLVAREGGADLSKPGGIPGGGLAAGMCTSGSAPSSALTLCFQRLRRRISRARRSSTLARAPPRVRRP